MKFATVNNLWAGQAGHFFTLHQEDEVDEILVFSTGCFLLRLSNSWEWNQSKKVIKWPLESQDWVMKTNKLPQKKKKGQQELILWSAAKGEGGSVRMVKAFLFFFSQNWHFQQRSPDNHLFSTTSAFFFFSLFNETKWVCVWADSVVVAFDLSKHKFHENVF